MGEVLQPLLRGGDPHLLQQLHGPLLTLGLGHLGVVVADGVGDLLPHGEHRGQGGQRVLEDHGDGVAAVAAHRLIAEPQDGLAVQQDLAFHTGGVREQAHDGHRGHRFAGAGLAHDAQHLAGVEVEVHTAHGVDGAGLAGESDVQVADREDRGAAADRCRLRGGHSGLTHVVALPPALDSGSSASRSPSLMSIREMTMNPNTATGAQNIQGWLNT